MDDLRRGALIRLHISVVLWGFTAILGKLISLEAFGLVWWRMLLTVLTLSPLLLIRSHWRGFTLRQAMKIGGIGMIVAVHWVCFYGSIKASNVSVALCCLATTSFIASFLEPIITRSRYRLFESLAGLVVVPAVYLIYFFNQIYLEGILLGLGAAFFAALFTSLNKGQVGTIRPQAYTLLQLSGGLVGLTIYILASMKAAAFLLPSMADLLWLIVLAGALTALPFVLAIKALERLSAFTSTLVVNLEPVYGILLAIFLLGEHEQLNLQFYIGAFAILGVVLLFPIVDRRLKSRENKASWPTVRGQAISDTR